MRREHIIILIITLLGAAFGAISTVEYQNVRYPYVPLPPPQHPVKSPVGILFHNIYPEIANELKVPVPYGALVTDIAKGSPAEVSGLKVNDIVLSFNDFKILNYDIEEPIKKEIEKVVPGEKLKLEVLRRGFDHHLIILIDPYYKDK